MGPRRTMRGASAPIPPDQVELLPAGPAPDGPGQAARRALLAGGPEGIRKAGRRPGAHSGRTAATRLCAGQAEAVLHEHDAAGVQGNWPTCWGRVGTGRHSPARLKCLNSIAWIGEAWHDGSLADPRGTPVFGLCLPACCGQGHRADLGGQVRPEAPQVLLTGFAAGVARPGPVDGTGSLSHCRGARLCPWACACRSADRCGGESLRRGPGGRASRHASLHVLRGWKNCAMLPATFASGPVKLCCIGQEVHPRRARRT